MPRPRPKSYKSRNIPRKHKTTTQEGKAEYMRSYMRIRRAELRGAGADEICKIDLQKTLGMDLSKLIRQRKSR